MKTELHTKQSRQVLMALCAGYALLSQAVFAAEWETNGGLTMVHLVARDSKVEDDQTLSADLFISRRDERGSFFIYVEGNSVLDDDRISTVFSESNADAGSALDADRKGRIQISELNYRFENAYSGSLTAGLIDPSAYLDRSRITNDENIQFLGASFVNNPAIEFPDYTIGLAWEKQPREDSPGINLVLTSARGLADNPNLSYSQLVQFTDDDDGLFAAAGAGWVREKSLLRIGAWVNTRPHGKLADPTSEGHDNYGVYTVLGRSFGEHSVNLRAGLARESVSEGAKFLGLAYRFLWNDFAIGLGAARTFLSTNATAPGRDDSSQYEIYARRSINDRFHFTISMQKIDNSGLTSVHGSEEDNATLAGIRFHYSI